MIDLDVVERLIRMLDDSGLDSLEIEDEETRIRLAKTPDGGVVAGPMHFPAPPPPPAPAPHPPHQEPGSAPAPAAAPDAGDGGAASHLVDVTSPMVGTFYRAPAPDAPPYVEVGSSIGKGDTLCIIEAMKLMNELESELSGNVAEICVDNGEPVEYGQVLFRVDPS